MKYSRRINSFFKRHNLYDEKMFRYLEEHTYMIDYRDEDMRVFVGCAYKLNKHNNKVEGFRICIPFDTDDITTMVSIHEIVHGIIGYKCLNKKFIKDITCEALSMLYEYIYISENPSEKLVKYGKYLDSMINDFSDESYKFALYARKEFFNNYDNDFDHMQKLTRKLENKYNKENR